MEFVESVTRQIYACWACDKNSETASRCINKRHVEIEIDGIDGNGDIAHDITDLGPCVCVCHNIAEGGLGADLAITPDDDGPGFAIALDNRELVGVS